MSRATHLSLERVELIGIEVAAPINLQQNIDDRIGHKVRIVGVSYVEKATRVYNLFAEEAVEGGPRVRLVAAVGGQGHDVVPAGRAVKGIVRVENAIVHCRAAVDGGWPIARTGRRGLSSAGHRAGHQRNYSHCACQRLAKPTDRTLL